MAKIYGTPIMAGGAGGMNKDLPPLLNNFKAFKGGVVDDGPNINVTIQADKMLESRANELAGAVWVYGDHEPESVNDGTKIQLSREEIITDKEPGPETITLADIPVSDAETETIVNLKETDGTMVPYLFLSNNYENSRSALLLRQACVQVGQYAAGGNTDFANYALDQWCNTTFVNTLDPSITAVLVEVNVPITRSQTQTIARKCFPLSASEYGGSPDASSIEGTALPYFNNNARRIAMLNETPVNYWTRTIMSTGIGYCWSVTAQGAVVSNTSVSAQHGYRPAIVLPLTFKLKATANSDGSYDMYEESSSTISTSDIDGNYQVTRTIQLDSTKDFFARQFTYNSKKQYQTMLEGAIAKIYSGQSIAELPSGSKVKLGTWNDTPLQWKVARDTSDQSLRLVLEPTSVSLLGNMQYDAPEPSNSDNIRKSYGNNRYIYSNIHQWLNATKASGWYTAQHSADAAPAYASSPGFLSGWSETDLSALDEATLTTTKASVDGGGTETFVARVALISTTELGLQSDTGGERMDIFNADGDRATGALYCTRTPHPSNTDSAYQVAAAGSIYAGSVSVAHGVRPLCSPKSTTYVSLQPDSDGCYTITGVNE